MQWHVTVNRKRGHKVAINVSTIYTISWISSKFYFLFSLFVFSLFFVFLFFGIQIYVITSNPGKIRTRRVLDRGPMLSSHVRNIVAFRAIRPIHNHLCSDCLHLITTTQLFVAVASFATCAHSYIHTYIQAWVAYTYTCICRYVLMYTCMHDVTD